MESLQREKFLRHPELLTKLFATGNEKLIAGNNKKEKFWGVNLITWEGENHLGSSTKSR